MQPCAAGFRESGGTAECRQRVSRFEGKPEQVSVTLAYQASYTHPISDKSTSVPKFGGRTMMQQFATALKYPDAPIVTVTGFNEWIAMRACLKKNPKLVTGWEAVFDEKACRAEPPVWSKEYTDHWPDGTRVFGDQYDMERNRDVEPAAGPTGDFYYRALKNCVANVRGGKPCSIQPLSLRPPEGHFDGVSGNLTGGWAYDPDTPKEPVDIEFLVDGEEPGCDGPKCNLLFDRAWRARPDVNKALGIQGDFGFSSGFPALLCDGKKHRLVAYARNTGPGEDRRLGEWTGTIEKSDQCLRMGTGGDDAVTHAGQGKEDRDGAVVPGASGANGASLGGVGSLKTQAEREAAAAVAAAKGGTSGLGGASGPSGSAPGTRLSAVPTVRSAPPAGDDSKSSLAACVPGAPVRNTTYGTGIVRVEQLKPFSAMIAREYGPLAEWVRETIPAFGNKRPKCLTLGAHLAYVMNVKLPVISAACEEKDWGEPNLAFTWDGLAAAGDVFARCGPEAVYGRCAACSDPANRSTTP